LKLVRDKSGLLIPSTFFDEKEMLKENLNKTVEETLSANSNVKGRYFIVFHARLDKRNLNALGTSCSVVRNLPRFMTNQIVFYVDNSRGLCEWLWTVTPNKKVEFNTKGVAYLQAKGAMPSRAESLA